MTMAVYSTKQVSNALISEIVNALKKVDSYGSIELYVQNNQVTQITTRNIKKTNKLQSNGHHNSINQTSI